MSYSRSNPSDKYKSLIAQYRLMHETGEQFLGIPPDKTFPGLSLPPQAARIKRLIDKTDSLNILDYGSGKGKQYDPMSIKIGNQKFDSIIDYWDVAGVHCYDPCYAPFSNLPVGQFDGVISTDVLEHCPEDDLPWILEEIFSYARNFVFANVACYPAKKRLPDGQNAHITIKSPEWWDSLLQEISPRFPQILWEVWIQTIDKTCGSHQPVETCLTNKNL